MARAGAQVAQLVEHATENRSVGGSIPPLGTTFFIGSIYFNGLRSVFVPLLCSFLEIGTFLFSLRSSLSNFMPEAASTFCRAARV